MQEVALFALPHIGEDSRGRKSKKTSESSGEALSRKSSFEFDLDGRQSEEDQQILLPVANEKIKCICSYQHDDGFLIECNKCNEWQHGVCMGVEKDIVPDVYECSVCMPEAIHLEIETAINLQQGFLKSYQKEEEEKDREKDRKGKDREEQGRKEERENKTGVQKFDELPEIMRAESTRKEEERAQKEREEKKRAEEENEEVDRAEKEREEKERAEKEKEEKERAEREREEEERTEMKQDNPKEKLLRLLLGWQDLREKDRKGKDKEREEKERAVKEREEKERAARERESREREIEREREMRERELREREEKARAVKEREEERIEMKQDNPKEKLLRLLLGWQDL